MRIIDRYILKSVVAIFLACIFVFLFLYVVIDLLSHLEDLLRHKINFELLAQYYLFNLPIMFVQVVPFACLLATLYTFGKLNHNNEIIAMRSSGLSIFQIAKTVMIFGALMSLLVFLVNDRFVPQYLEHSSNIKEQMEQETKKAKDQKEEVINNLSMYGLKNRLFFISKFYSSEKTIEGITILEHDENQNLKKKIVANKGTYQNGVWKFYQCVTYKFDNNGQVIEEPQYFEEEIMAIPEGPKDFLNQRQRSEFMTINELDEYIWKLSKSGATGIIRSLKTDYYQRFAWPFSSLIIIMLGIPFSLMIKKRATGLSSIGISIMVGFLYYILDAVCVALGKKGTLSPYLAAYLSHIIAFGYSWRLIKTLP